MQIGVMALLVVPARIFGVLTIFLLKAVLDVLTNFRLQFPLNPGLCGSLSGSPASILIAERKDYTAHEVWGRVGSNSMMTVRYHENYDDYGV